MLLSAPLRKGGQGWAKVRWRRLGDVEVTAADHLVPRAVSQAARDFIKSVSGSAHREAQKSCGPRGGFSDDAKTPRGHKSHTGSDLNLGS